MGELGTENWGQTPPPEQNIPPFQNRNAKGWSTLVIRRSGKRLGGGLSSGPEYQGPLGKELSDPPAGEVFYESIT